MRAHVAALGGNPFLSFSLNQCVLLDNPNRNQAQCLINIVGDAAFLEPRGDMKFFSDQKDSSDLRRASALKSDSQFNCQQHEAQSNVKPTVSSKPPPSPGLAKEKGLNDSPTDYSGTFGDGLVNKTDLIGIPVVA